jgi:O-antigen/teichoic acid export membrane protein
MAAGRVSGTPRPGWLGKATSLLWLLGGVGAAALATYVYLIVVARDVGPAEYAGFSAFWAVVVIAGTGIYLPIEQETARRGVHHGPDRPSRSLLRSAVLATAVISAVLTGAMLLLWPVVGGFFADDELLGLALVVGCVGYAVQYPVRGLLSARRQYGRYASVLGAEALLRIVLVAGLVILADPGRGAFAAVVGLAALGSAVVGLVGAGASNLGDAGGARALLRSGTLLIAGAVALQTLLYGGVVVARILAPEADEAVAGQLLAAITVTRIPVFLFQSMESLVVPRIAELSVRGDKRGLLRAVRWLVVVVLVLAVVTATASATIGPQVVLLMFGAGYEVSHGTMALLGLGTGVFMLAVAASDVTVSLHGHRLMAIGWGAGLVAGVLSVLVVPDFLLQVTLPLIVGSVVAAGVLARAAYARISATLTAGT